jgi:hypothetical protein
LPEIRFELLKQLWKILVMAAAGFFSVFSCLDRSTNMMLRKKWPTWQINVMRGYWPFASQVSVW